MILNNNDKPETRLVAGCMTGTSIDGLDVALVKIKGHGLLMRAEVQRCLSRPLGELTGPLRMLARQEPMPAGEITRIARDFGLLHLQALKELIGDKEIDLVAVHGQTVFHRPPLSWQLINPAPIAYGLDVPVVYDMRAADLAIGGQGAPITPLADFILFRDPDETRCIVNLGGFCNITILPACMKDVESGLPDCVKLIHGRDVCACNQLLDRIARVLFRQPYDKNGENAVSGVVQTKPFNSLLALLEAQSGSNRSLGTGDELLIWLDDNINIYKPNDLARIACAAIAETITTACKSTDRLILAGGSVKNKALMAEIFNRSKVPVDTSDEYGVPAQFREAVAMAVLGALCHDRTPITLPSVTGVDKAPVSGCWVMP